MLYFVTARSVISSVWKCLSSACFSTRIWSFPLKSKLVGLNNLKLVFDDFSLCTGLTHYAKAFKVAFGMFQNVSNDKVGCRNQLTSSVFLNATPLRTVSLWEHWTPYIQVLMLSNSIANLCIFIFFRVLGQAISSCFLRMATRLILKMLYIKQLRKDSSVW